MLGGDFGNLTFSYDGMTLLSRLLMTGRMGHLTREIRALRRNGMRFGKIAAQLIGPLLPQSAWRGISRLRGKGRRLTDYTAINPRLAGDLELRRRAAARKLDFSYRPWSDAAELRLWVLGRNDPGNYIKGTLAGWGLDGRDPTSDRRLVEFCLSVPDEQFLRDGIPRALARNALADRLPDAVRLERRKGYQAADWHENLSAAREELRSEIERLEGLPAAAELLDMVEIRRLVDYWPVGAWHEDRVISRYRLALLRGVSAGHFLRRASGSNQ
jgi:asparagine synthase (glutamine-hydrolysing)